MRVVINDDLVKEVVSTTGFSIEDAVEADYVFTTLMGDQVDPRKAFIEQHAKEVVHLDI